MHSLVFCDFPSYMERIHSSMEFGIDGEMPHAFMMFRHVQEVWVIWQESTAKMLWKDVQTVGPDVDI